MSRAWRVPTRGLVGTSAGKFLWPGVSQGISSLTNLLLSVSVATSVGVKSFGEFGIVMATYWFVLGAMRSLVCEPLLMMPGRDVSDYLSRRAIGVSLFAGGIATCVLGVAALLAHSWGLGILAIASPVFLVQDALRYLYFACGAPNRASALDLVWLLTFVAMAGSVLLSDNRVDMESLIAMWATGALASAALGLANIRLWPCLEGGFDWLRNPAGLRLNLFLDFAITTGLQQLLVFVVAALATLNIVGGYKAAQVACGPLPVLILTATLISLRPLAEMHAGHEVTRARRFALKVSLAGGFLGGVWSLLLWGVPDGLGTALLGDSWLMASSAAWIFALHLSVIAGAQGAVQGLRAGGRARTLFRSRLALLPSNAGLPLLGLAHGGLDGLAFGTLAAGIVSALVWWSLFLRDERLPRADKKSQPDPIAII